jgi:hypothetical protein
LLKVVSGAAMFAGQNSGEKLGYLRLSSNIVAPATAAVESVGPK